MNNRRLSIHRVHWFAVVCVTIATLSTGCRLPRPFLGPGGPMEQQQQEASVFDPYTDTELGPEVVGGRPREFQKPAPEPVRNHWFSDMFWGR